MGLSLKDQYIRIIYPGSKKNVDTTSMSFKDGYIKYLEEKYRIIEYENEHLWVLIRSYEREGKERLQLKQRMEEEKGTAQTVTIYDGKKRIDIPINANNITINIENNYYKGNTYGKTRVLAKKKGI